MSKRTELAELAHHQAKTASMNAGNKKLIKRSVFVKLIAFKKEPIKQIDKRSSFSITIEHVLATIE
ncbi:hypothetical protein T03_1618 [Trichinella britovi]|uniref:Uncharacterized protein n=1 Tax=Trichinella britovi TaxID=45882 RepID=A0A0V1CIF6_TRIBR|nr:hypothetical protein T03_5331 [Trichinella britovi]KRY54481.1 hypothetical protein T03_1618 [Trichinella britovi]